MKRLPEHGPGEFNPPAEMLARAALLVMLTAVVAGSVLVGAGLIAQHWPSLLAGVLSLACGSVTRQWLKRTGRLELADSAFNALRAEPAYPDADDARVAELVRLLREWAAQDKRRGTPEFDPWALQAVRQEIRALVAGDAALADLLRGKPPPRRG